MAGFFGLGAAGFDPNTNLSQPLPWQNMPGNSLPQNGLQNTVTAPKAVGAFTPNLPGIQNPGAYQAQDFSQPLPEYDLARNQLSSQLSSQQAGANDQMQRQFAALVGGPGGAAIRQSELQNNDFASQRAGGMNSINMQEAMQRRSLQQQQDQMAFQSGEAQKARTTQIGEQNQNMAYQTGLENVNIGFQNNQQKMQGQQMGFDNNAKIQGLNMAYNQSLTDQRTNAFNAELQQYTSNNSGGLLGGGGFLGTGLF